MSPTSPLFDSFINPFAASRSENSSKAGSRPDLHHRGSSTTHASTRSMQPRDERPNTSNFISPSPSLRSKSSDISSSQASFFARAQGSISGLPIQQLPSDLPSPASTAGYDDGQSILGWTSAQGRSSALSNHTRVSNSISSVAGTPPAPRETILDRAFAMRYVPGSERADEENGRMSSIARFEALMKEAEERRHAKDAIDARKKPTKNTTGWELEEEDEDSEATDSDDEPIDQEEDAFHLEEDDDHVDPLSLSIHEMPTPAQRALEYISSGRTTPLPRNSNSQQRPQSPPPPVPQSRPQPPIRSRTTPPVTKRRERPKSLHIPSNSYSLSAAAAAATENGDKSTSTTLKRTSSTHTSNSAKRLSLTDFAKRLSSTSSLLLVQTNASTGSTSSRNSSSADGEEVTLHRGLSQSRLSGMATGGMFNSGMEERNGDTNQKAHWNGSRFGVFGGEGGFL
jgi:hypothetical protein